MSLIVEDGTARSDAESLASVAEVDAYHTARGTPDASWVDLDTDVKEQRILRANDYMLQVYKGRWKGSPVNSTQALDWPRYNVQRDPSFLAYIAHTTIPYEVKRAVAELALRASSALLADVVPQAGVTSERVGPIAVTYEYTGQKQTRYAAVDGILTALLEDGGSSTMMTARLG